jgi:hypothetical protein
MVWCLDTCKTLKSKILWDVVPFNLPEVQLCFRGVYSLNLQYQRASQRQCILVPLKYHWTYTELHGVTMQTIMLSVVTTVRSSNPRRENFILLPDMATAQLAYDPEREQCSKKIHHILS